MKKARIMKRALLAVVAITCAATITWALLWPNRLWAPAWAPYRLGNVSASQLASPVAPEPPLKLLIKACPRAPTQK